MSNQLQFIPDLEESGEAWLVRNRMNNAIMGTVHWVSGEAQFCFYPKDGAVVLTSNKLDELDEFLRQQTTARSVEGQKT